MKKMSQRTSQIVISIIILAIGVLLIIMPSIAGSALSYIIGGLSIVLGVYGVLRFFIYKQTASVLNDFVSGATLLTVGIYFIINTGFLPSIIFVLISIILVVNGFLFIGRALTYSKYKGGAWWLNLIIGVVLVGLGIAILFFKDTTEPLFIRLIGASLSVAAIVDLASYAFGKKG